MSPHAVMSRNVSWDDSCPFHFQFDPRSVHSFPPSAIPTWITVITINSIAALPTFYTNLLVIWTIFENESLRSVNYNFLLAVLSLTDLLVGLLIQPLFIATKVCIIVQCSQLCNVHMIAVASSVMCIGWSLCTLVILSLERYFFIEHPLHYTAIVSAKKLRISTIIGWAVMPVALFLGEVVFKRSNRKRSFLGASIFTLSIVIIVFCLAKVTLTAHRQRRAINVQQAAFQQTIQSVQNRIKECKRTFTFGLIVLASFLCYCPFLTIRIVTSIREQGDDVDFNHIAEAIALTCLHFQSLVNPCILSLRLSRIRGGVLRKMRTHLTWWIP